MYTHFSTRTQLFNGKMVEPGEPVEAVRDMTNLIRANYFMRCALGNHIELTDGKWMEKPGPWVPPAAPDDKTAAEEYQGNVDTASKALSEEVEARETKNSGRPSPHKSNKSNKQRRWRGGK